MKPAWNHLTIGHESPVDDYLIKPFDAATLITKIMPFINRAGPQKTVISSGNGELDSKMGGGIASADVGGRQLRRGQIRPLAADDFLARSTTASRSPFLPAKTPSKAWSNKCAAWTWTF
ncbi:MAG: hypothetical protein H6661_11010 [Ardenticatenaceae bacterium]|nr:hypothetical protein [Ardenticatenaceae bacterium]